MAQMSSRPWPLGIHLDVTNRLWQQVMEKSIAYTWINRPHWLALSAIEELGDGCTLTQIVSHLHSDISTISRALKFLEQHELITKDVQDDKRAKGVFMAPEGVRILREIDQAAQRVRAQLLAETTPEQRAVFQSVLSSIRTQATQMLEHEDSQLQRSSAREEQ
ncbi:MarR family transcriptional regulator [Salmonella enterica subsp. enterica serovar Choleraesuis]|nr:MarR family transcriptional regulator [Salmonella enterica subsp. enterica serovar Choleraesuis]